MNVSAKSGSRKINQISTLGNKSIDTEEMMVSLREMLKGWYQQLKKIDRFLAIVPFITSYEQWN